MQLQDIMGEDDSSGVSHLIHSSPHGVSPGARTAPALRSLVYPSSPSSSGHHAASNRPNSPWGGGLFIHSIGSGKYSMPSAPASTSTITTSLQPRSAADSGLDHHLSYFDSHHDRPSTFHSTAGSNPSCDAYTYGAVPDSLFLRSDTSSYIPTSQLGSYLQDYSSSSLPNDLGMSDPGHISMNASQQRASDDLFYSSDGVYSLGNSASSRGHQSTTQEVNTPQPPLSFTFPGIPSAEEAFLTHIHQSTNGMNDAIEEPLPRDPQRDLLILPSGYQQPLDFDNEDHQDIERNLYHTHIGSRSPSSSDSSRSSQKRAREELDALPNTGAEPSTLGVDLPAIKRQRLDDIADGLSSSINLRGRKAHFREFANKGISFGSDGDEDDIFDSGDDSDAYIPSRSPSPVLPTVLLTSPSPPASTTEEYIPTAAKGKAGRRKGKAKGKAKGSAARALAVITKVREQQDLQEMTEFGCNEWSGGDDKGTIYYPLGGGASEGEGGSNDNRSTTAHPPVPVPNLTKKSRGRKVPYVAALRGGEGIGEGFPLSGIVAMGPSGRRGRRRAAVGESSGTTSDCVQAQAQVPTGEDRNFVCVVPGCGKCFVRGEHLKRHVRSIHTDDKPFLCPYKGCGKSFSRRDNLGQHVRIHLND